MAQRKEPIVVGVAHREGGLGRFLPPPGCSGTAFWFIDLDVPQIEPGAYGFRDGPDRKSLLRRPAPEVEDDGAAADEDLVGDPDHAAFKDVPSTVGVAVPEQRGHPLVRSQAKDAVLIRDPTSQRRLARTWQPHSQIQDRHRVHAPNSHSGDDPDANHFSGVQAHRGQARICRQRA
ncbi:hypothetical protein [Nocardioides sp.]|uniref:hypothetical protein n=1 Tax=Nocardioides sp. TaxID=35761 RepID=UPI0031FE6213